MTDGDQLAEQARALRQARESLHAVLAGHPDWMALTALDAEGEAAPNDERTSLEQALSGMPAFVALRQVDDALAQIEAEIARARPVEPLAGVTTAVEPGPVVAEPTVVPEPERGTSAQPKDELPADDLTRIRGIDTAMQARLAALGVTRFEQIATWWPADVRRFGDELGIGRAIVRQSWVTQAELLMRQRAPAARPVTLIETQKDATAPDAAAPDRPVETVAVKQAKAVEMIEVVDAVEAQAPANASAPKNRLAAPLEIKFAQAIETDASEPSEPIRLSQIIDPVPAHKPQLDVIEATFSPAPADGADAAKMQLADPPSDTGMGADAAEPPPKQHSDGDELAEILAMIRHSSARAAPDPAQPAPRSNGLKARIEAATEGAPRAAAPAEPISLIEAAHDGQRKMPALGEPQRAALASLDRLAALESAVDAMANTDAVAAAPDVPTERTTPLAPPLPVPAPDLREVALDEAEADVEIVRRAQPVPSAQAPRRGAETSQDPPAFVGAEEASVVIVRRAAGEAAPALPFYAQKPPETQSTVRRFMSALTGPAAKPPE